MSGWKIGDKFLLKIRDGSGYRTEWFEIDTISPGPRGKVVRVLRCRQAGTLLVELLEDSVDEHAIPFDDAIVNLEQGLGQYTPQYKVSPAKPFSKLKEGDLVEVDPDKSSFAEHLYKRTGQVVFPLEVKDNSHMPVRLDGMWVEREAVIGVDFDA